MVKSHPLYNFLCAGGPPPGMSSGGGGPPSGVTSGDPSSGTTSGGPPSGITSGGGPPTGASSINIPAAGRADICFLPNPGVEFTIFAFMIIYYIPSILIYIKYRNHVLIKYRQPKEVLTASIDTALMSILIPLFRYFEVPCYINTWIINPLVFSSCIITYSRYVRVFFIQKLSIFRLRFAEKKNKSNRRDKSGNLLLKDPILKQSHETQSLKAGSLTTSSLSTTQSENIFGIADPLLYFKILNQLITKKLILILVVCPVIFIIVYSIIITITKWDSMERTCVNEHQSVGMPKTILNGVIAVSSLFFFYQAYYKQKWDIEFKIEYTIFILGIILGTGLIHLTVKGHLTDTFVEYRMYIFVVFAGIVHLMCVIKPLISIGLHKLKKSDEKLTQEEFLAKMSNTIFKAQVKEIATKTFCIENVLFFDAYCDLMNMVINYYSKKSNIPVSDVNSYSSADILHRNTINPLLYKPFESVFKTQYDQIYNLYIKEDGIASINIKSTTIKNIEELVENNNYNYLMFYEAAEEVGDLLYSNIYTRMSDY